jgi:salicylate hydroxylase
VSSGSGTIIFQNGVSVTADMIIGADGIHSSLRESIGIVPDAERSDSCCYRWIIQASKLKELGLESLMPQDGTEIWGGFGIEKIVIGSCHGGEVIGAFCFYP